MLDALAVDGPGGRTKGVGMPGMTGETRGLVYRVGATNLLDAIDLRVSSRSLTVVLGPNGAGKSLLLRLMHGLLRPTAGEVLWGGRPLDEALRESQAMVFQRPVLLRRSVAANPSTPRWREVLRERAGPRRYRNVLTGDDFSIYELQ